MAGYIYFGSKASANTDKSPTQFVMTFKRKANERFDAMVANAKKAGCKLGEVEEYECPAYEQCEQERQVIKTCSGTDKAGNAVKFFLERVHVGGQLEQRRAEENGG